MNIRENLTFEDQWVLVEQRYESARNASAGGLFLIGNGYLGYRGTLADQRASDYVGLVLTDTYDNADGKWTELCTVPNPLFATLALDGQQLSMADTAWDPYRRSLDLSCGLWTFRAENQTVTIQEQRFSCLERRQVLARRFTVAAKRDLELSLTVGIDGQVWSINGQHLVEQRGTIDADTACIVARTFEHGYGIAAAARSQVAVGLTTLLEPGAVSADMVDHRVQLSLPAGQTLVLDTFAAVGSSNDLAPTTERPGPRPESLDPLVANLHACLDAAEASGYETLLAEQKDAWRRLWERHDVTIAGADLHTAALRFNTYHNIIATPIHADHLPIGARGLSCQVYQGSAFWDQEIFNLPMFMYSDPALARNVLVYRHKTLAGARRKAQQLGYRGAYYAWVSADTGDEICPSYFFIDVLTGRPIRNHFNDWQMHISPDIAYAIARYVQVTGDEAFLLQHGAEVLFEIARFLYSRSHLRPDLARYEILRVLGPDEYHENVDNNFFTNYQARFAAEYAVGVYDQLARQHPEELQRIAAMIELENSEPDQWRDFAARVFVPQPEAKTGLIEQFAGFFDHEDTTPAELKTRLIDQSEYWGWPNGVAVATQVSKQADVVQLFALHLDAFDPQVVKRNWEYYEPRTQHGSSLSPSVYAVVAARLGNLEHAERYFHTSLMIDLLDTNKAVSGGTFIGGIHTAACGASWQIAVLGFAGLSEIDGGFALQPHLPASWNGIAFSLERFGCRVQVDLKRNDDRLVATWRAAADNPKELQCGLGEALGSVAPGAELTLEWETETFGR